MGFHAFLYQCLSAVLGQQGEDIFVTIKYFTSCPVDYFDNLGMDRNIRMYEFNKNF